MVLVGIHEQYQGPTAIPVDETLERFPDTRVTREFTSAAIPPQNLIPKIENACAEVWEKGLTAAWSFKPDPKAVLSGAWKPYLEQLASYLLANPHKKVIVIIWHEPENDIPKYFTSPENFVQVFNKVHATLIGVNPNIVTCHAALGYRYADNIDITDAVAPRWKTNATINAIDIYSGRSFKLATTLPELSGFKRWLRFVVGTGTYGVTERGWIAAKGDSALSQVRADTIRREADWLRTDPDGRRCTLYIAWNTIGAEGDPDIPLDAAGEEAVRYLMTKVNEADPEPDPEPEPVSIVCPLCTGKGTVPKGQVYTIVRAA